MGNRRFYDYTLAYPGSMGGAVFYVGKGSYSQDARQDRIDMHEQEARRGCGCRKCQIIRDIWAYGEQVVKKKVLETGNEQDSFIYEWILINLVYGRENLANKTGGGAVKTVWHDALTGKTQTVKPQGFAGTESKIFRSWYQQCYYRQKRVNRS